MKKFSKLELLSEGFWDAFTKPAKFATGLARGAVAGGAKALDYVLPELTNPVKSAVSAIKDIGSATKEGFDKGYKGILKYATDQLADLGYIVKSNEVMTPSGRNFVIPAYKVLQYETDGRPKIDKSATPFLIDKSGRILRNLRHAKMHP